MYRTLDWSRDDNGDLVALNPYEGDLESSDYATRYVVRRDENLGFVVSGEYGGVERRLGTFADDEEARGAAQKDADERAEPS
jgi:hypothetical protein